MNRKLVVASESWPLKQAFRIARGTKTEAVVVVAMIVEGEFSGRGECVPYARYGESVQSVIAQIETLRRKIETGVSRDELQRLLPAGAARNALDCALVDLEAKATGKPAFEILGLQPPAPVRTAFTLSVDEPEAMGRAAAAAAAKGYGLLKLKVAGGKNISRVEAVRNAAPQARLIVDANEGWTPQEYDLLAPGLAALGVALIEQPLRAEDDGYLGQAGAPVALCADESCHTRADLQRIRGRYTYVNVKLDKAGGLTEAVALAREASALGLKLMVGCMVSTSLAMAPASLLAGMADFVDLDGPLLLARDREPALRYETDVLYPPSRELWG
jgi:L-alanine-DL-glutamate epimerase-like enolase superfamily enzyme